MRIVHRTLQTKVAATFAALIFAGACAPAFAQQSMQPIHSGTSMQGSQLTPMDRTFITDMLQETRAQQAFAELAQRRASSESTIRAAHAISTEWTTLGGRLTGLALAAAAPIRGTLTANQHAQLWNLGRTPRARFDRVYLHDAQRGNTLAFARIREEDATSNVRIAHFLDEARPLISGYQAMLAADIGRLPQTAQLPMENVGSMIQ